MRKEKDLEVSGEFLKKIEESFEADALIVPTPEPTEEPTPEPTKEPEKEETKKPEKEEATKKPEKEEATKKPEKEEATKKPAKEEATKKPAATEAPATEVPEPTENAEPVGEEKPVLSVTPPASSDSKLVESRKYTDMQHYLYTAACELREILKKSEIGNLETNEEILLVCEELAATCDSLAVSLGQKELNWKIEYWNTTNEIYVDFR